MRLLATRHFIQAVEVGLSETGRFPLLGIDYGIRRIGLALSDPGCNIAMPLHILNTPKGTPFKSIAQEFGSVVKTRGIQGLVVGWPLMEMGQVGEQCMKVETFLENLYHFDVVKDDLPVLLWDERHTSNMVMERIRMQRQEELSTAFANPTTSKHGKRGGNRKRVKKSAQAYSSLKLPKSESLDHEVAAYILQEFLDSSKLSGQVPLY